MAEFEILTLDNTNRWKMYLNQLTSIERDFYYTPEYYSIYESHGEGKACCFVFKEGNRLALYPFLINSINSLGYELDSEYYDIQGAYGYNGIISNSLDPKFIDSFFNTFWEYCVRNNIVAEFTRFHPLLENHYFAQNHMKIILDRSTVFLDLKHDYQKIWTSDYSSQNRNKIRKAKKLGFSCQILHNPDRTAINQFIDAYTANMNAVGADKYYFFNTDYFYNTLHLLQDFAYLFNVLDYNHHIICSSIVILYENWVHYHFSGRLPYADNSVNNFLLDHIVRFGLEKQASLLFLGGGRSAMQDDSLLIFKMNFSKTTKPFYIGHKVHNEKIYNLIIQQWKKRDSQERLKYAKRLLRYRH